MAGAWNFSISSPLSKSVNNKIQVNSGISAVPNPFTDQLSVKMVGIKGSKVTLEIYDALGKKYLSKNFELQSDNYIIVLDQWVSKLASGMYYLHVISSELPLQTLSLIKK